MAKQRRVHVANGMLLVLHQDHVAVRHKGLRLVGRISEAEPVDLDHDLEPVGGVRGRIDSRVIQGCFFAVASASDSLCLGLYFQWPTNHAESRLLDSADYGG